MPDGSLRPCLDFHGKGIMKKFKIKDLYENKNQIRQNIKEMVAYDMKKCPGCFWDPKIISSMLLKAGVSSQDGGSFFDHSRSTKKRIETYSKYKIS